MFRAPALLFLLPLMALLTACAREENVIMINDRFSMNVARVPGWFPGDEEQRATLTATEEAVLREKGRPDFIRFWWRRDGGFITSSDLAGRQDGMEDLVGEMKKTWIYRQPAIEVEFVPAGGYLEHPMTEKLKLICDYGDPSFKEGPRPNRSGQMKETWNWMDHGIYIEFLDDVEINRRHYTGSGEGTYLGH
jgi:hypothetical protein